MMKSPSFERLIEVLSELEALLTSGGAAHWAHWMSSARERIQRGDAGGVDHLLGAYGGMGSFNDLVLGQSMTGGQFQWKKGANEMNGRLERLREEAYVLASSFRSVTR